MPTVQIESQVGTSTFDAVLDVNDAEYRQSHKDKELFFYRDKFIEEVRTQNSAQGSFAGEEQALAPPVLESSSVYSYGAQRAPPPQRKKEALFSVKQSK